MDLTVSDTGGRCGDIVFSVHSALSLKSRYTPIQAVIHVNHPSANYLVHKSIN